ncbi:hypothetical protein [Terrihabitans rhizophilus]|uniref:Uncharacterized protein n=1 Tax=Terrihabitans rhizophilus TaxID=3092662 RepID=A0ABU4RRW7_9HYPH|nr:hypothetical protein [Terrihabitans sp. PJ23]MDX6806923.1 hypothetical protein [Terrihabitans sp. PJ23]
MIFSYAKQSIGAVGVASSAAYDAPQPEEFENAWDLDGRKVDVVYRTINPAVRLATFVDDLISLLPERNSPITNLKKGVQGYLFAIPPKAGQLICERLDFWHRSRNSSPRRSPRRCRTKLHGTLS